MPADRLYLFADSRVGFSPALVAAALAASARQEGVVVQGIVETDDSPTPTRGSRPRRLAEGLLRAVFDPPEQRRERPRARPPTLRSVAQRFQVPLVVPPSRDVNHPDFQAWMADGPGAAMVLSLGCLQRLHKPLLEACAVAVNFHDASLPAYRGIRATAWSLYRGEPHSGFTFHHMDEGLDTGPILLQETLPVPSDGRPRDLLRAKLRQACAAVDRVLGGMIARSPGLPQTGQGSYFGRRELAEITTIADPSALTWADLERRLRAFDKLTLTLAGDRWPVTALRRLAGGEGNALAFTGWGRGISSWSRAPPTRTTWRGCSWPVRRGSTAGAPTAGAEPGAPSAPRGGKRQTTDPPGEPWREAPGDAPVSLG